MKAVRFVGAGCPAQVVDVPTPRPGPGEVLVKIGGAGACHSDLHVLKHGRRGAPPQFTLGHENAGWIAELGNGTQGWKEGEAVAVYPLWGCGHCPACAKSAENHCVSFRPEMPRVFGGLGRDGGMAELIYFSKCLMERNLCIPVFSAAAFVATALPLPSSPFPCSTLRLQLSLNIGGNTTLCSFAR